MKKELNDESLEIELEIESWIIGLSRKITVKKGIIAYQNSRFGQNTSGEKIMSSSDFNDLFRDIESYRIAPFPKSPVEGLDGTTYTIRIKNGFCSVTYSWWAECPPEWEKVGKLADNLIDYAKRNIEKL